ncbi:hypothetical protein G8A07_17230 [Roseateles sp. DAIF2]|uniref:hypothetical protein n=1 Tax=Roseateles sp. DAIF2 TaxID=2714952 RepID=UPI0018A2BE44|nr:hypothetical protein [Roseateles sp. DAIF2]QPF74484.1 hypothetical protein G8A07_17230 [Roseateles sp. DAIF2]
MIIKKNLLTILALSGLLSLGLADTAAAQQPAAPQSWTETADGQVLKQQPKAVATKKKAAAKKAKKAGAKKTAASGKKSGKKGALAAKKGGKIKAKKASRPALH